MHKNGWVYVCDGDEECVFKLMHSGGRGNYGMWHSMLINRVLLCQRVSFK